MAGYMAQKPPVTFANMPLPPGAVADTGNINQQVARDSRGNPIVVPPVSYAQPPPPPMQPVQNVNQQAANLFAPPPGLPDSGGKLPNFNVPVPQQGPVTFTNQAFGDLATGPTTPQLPALDIIGNRNKLGGLPMGAVGDTGNIAQGTTVASPVLAGLSGMANAAGAKDVPDLWKDFTDQQGVKKDLVPNGDAKVEGAIWAGMGPQERTDYYQLHTVLDRGILKEDTPEYRDVQTSLHNVIVQAQYRGLIQHAWDAQATAGTGPEGKDFGGFFNENLLGGGATDQYSPNIVLWYDKNSGLYSIKSKQSTTAEMLSDARRDPTVAGDLIVALLRAKMIPGASEKYAQDYLRFDAKGNPIGQWPSEYDKYIRDLVDQVSQDQYNAKAPDKFVAGAWEMLLARGGLNQAVQNDPNLTNHAYGATGSGGGGGGFSRGGGRSSSFASRMFQSDPAMLSAQLDSYGKSLLGRAMTPQEHQDFITYVHELETQQSQLYMNGSRAMAYQPDPQSQALQWINTRYGAEYQSEQAGEYVKALAAFLRGPGLGGGGN